MLTTKTATESNVLAWFPACCMQCVQVYSVNLCRHLWNHSRNARIIAQNMSHYFTQQKMQSKQNYVSSLGVFEVLCGVFPGVFEEPLLIRQPFSVRTELFIGFMGVFDDPELFDPEELWFNEPLIAESLFDKLRLSVILRCQRICGPLVNGASILITLLSSFSNPKWLIAAKTQKTAQSASKTNNFPMVDFYQIWPGQIHESMSHRNIAETIFENLLFGVIWPQKSQTDILLIPGDTQSWETSFTPCCSTRVMEFPSSLYKFFAWRMVSELRRRKLPNFAFLPIFPIQNA